METDLSLICSVSSPGADNSSIINSISGIGTPSANPTITPTPYSMPSQQPSSLNIGSPHTSLALQDAANTNQSSSTKHNRLPELESGDKETSLAKTISDLSLKTFGSFDPASDKDDNNSLDELFDFADMLQDPNFDFTIASPLSSRQSCDSSATFPGNTDENVHSFDKIPSQDSSQAAKSAKQSDCHAGALVYIRFS